MKYSDLREPMSDWLARQLSERVESSPATKPTGELALGDGDLTWRGPGWVTDPDNPGGPLIPGPSWETWSVKDVPRITETLTRDLEQAEDRLAQAKTDLDSYQGVIDGVTLDLDLLNSHVGTIDQTAQDAYNKAVAAEQASTGATITVTITSSGGTIFTDGPINTVLTATVHQGGEPLTPAQVADLGTLTWYTGEVLAGTGPTLTVTPGTDHATYECRLETYGA